MAAFCEVLDVDTAANAVHIVTSVTVTLPVLELVFKTLPLFASPSVTASVSLIICA